MDELLTWLRALLPMAAGLAAISVDGPDGDLFTEELALIQRAGPVRRSEFRAARIAARRALNALHVPAGAVLAYPEGDPIWPRDVLGSITHAEGWAIAVAALRSDVAAVGIDLEGAEPLDNDLRSLVCGPKEREQDSGLTELGLDAAKLRFVAKEAWYKAVFPKERRFMDFHDVVVRFDLERGQFAVRRAQSLDKDDSFSSGHTMGHFKRSGRLLCALFLDTTPTKPRLAPPSHQAYFR